MPRLPDGPGASTPAPAPGAAVIEYLTVSHGGASRAEAVARDGA